jgi:DNA-binding PadR family transcriptional regulator
MKWDEIDRAIIVLLATKDMTISEIANNIFELSGGTDRRAKSAFIRYRIQSMMDEGIIAAKTETGTYNLLNCEVVEGTFKGKRIEENDDIEIDLGYTIILHGENDIIGLLPVKE